MTEEGNDIGTPEEEPTPKPTKQPKPAGENWSKLEPIAYNLGKYAWILALINGIIYIIWGIIDIVGYSIGSWYFGIGAYFLSTAIWYLIGGIIVILLGFFVVKPRFSDKCAAKDWDFLLNDVLLLGNFRFPKMLLWAIILEIFSIGWGGLFILIPLKNSYN
ncbi:MAG: hypothetical protein P8Y97_19205 [Candidatus Lokiarchaeota archaeon]